MKQFDSVESGRVVVFHYTLTDDDGETLDTSVGEDPMATLQGADNVVPGLEEALEGKAVGEKFKVSVPPEEGYGPKQGPGPQPVPRGAFGEGFEPQAGMPVLVEDDDGNQMPLWIVEIQEDKILIDGNHPLAGATLHFEVEILKVREASEEEKVHGHPHGPDGDAGHHHHH